MRQNKYDDPDFFAQYSTMPRSVEGLSAAGEWYALRQLLPDLRDKRVLDLGCGFGWHCRYAREQQARQVVGVDLSEKMLARARELTDDPAIEYHQAAIEDTAFPADRFDVVLSSLAFHYVANLDTVFARVFACLSRDGAFVFSVEHPIFSARAVQDWHYGPQGERLHWPVDDYQSEGVRHSHWLTGDVIKYHRTVSTYLNAVIGAGFQITGIAEAPSPESLDGHPEWQEESRRPMFLLVGAIRR
jgi:SAM-dependent methyltransferase